MENKGTETADVDALIALLDGRTQAGDSRIKLDVVEGQGELCSLVSRQVKSLGSIYRCQPGKSIEFQPLLRLDEGGVTVHSVPPRGVFMRILHENPETHAGLNAGMQHFLLAISGRQCYTE